jgi:spore germination protein GerM
MTERKNLGKNRAPARKTPARRGKSEKMQLAAVFWLVFLIVLSAFFLANRETISKNFNTLARRITPSSEAAPESEGRSDPVATQPSPDRQPNVTAKPPNQPEAKPSTPDKTESLSTQTPAATQKPPVTQTPSTQTPPATKPPATQTPPANQQPANPPATQKPPAVKPVETRERGIYLMQVDKDGVLFRVRVSRSLPVSDSPMIDSLSALFAGPNADERHRGLLSLIPPNTRILSATVRGSTAYINFSEDFQYNTYGVEGDAAQLKQIVWTVTEFSNVKDVQILIEGRRIDYLGEGIWIGSPISRESL